MQDFGEMTYSYGSGLDFIFDGVLGLGFDTIAINHMVPPVYNMVNQKLLDNPVFAFYFGKTDNGKSDQAEVTFGGIDRRHYTGEIVKLPLRRNFSWETVLDAVTFGNETAELYGAGVQIDTGTSLIGLPSSLAELV